MMRYLNLSDLVGIYFILYPAVWALIGVLSKAGWIKPTGIDWLDVRLSHADRTFWEAWNVTGRWFTQAVVIIVGCLVATILIYFVVVVAGLTVWSGIATG